MLYRFKQMHVQPLMPHCTIESFNVGILGGLARLNIEQRNLVLIRPVNQTLRQVFWAIVSAEQGL